MIVKNDIPLFDLLDKIINIDIIMIIVAGVILIAAIVWKRQKTDTPNDSVHIGKKGQAAGVIFGIDGKQFAYSPESDEGHVVVVGGSGLGKTSAMLVATLRSWNGTAFVIDISGDIGKNVPNMDKLVFDVENPKSAPYNIFAPIDDATDIINKNELLEQLAYMIMPDSAADSDTTAFFTGEGRKMFTAALITYYHADKDFIDICKCIVGHDWRDLLNNIVACDNQQAIMYISSFMGVNERNTAGCKQAVDKAIILFATNARLEKTIRRPQKDEECICAAMLENTSVFVTLPDAKLEIYAPLLNIITAQFLIYMSGRPEDCKSNILFCLDEFASFGRMEITAAMRKLRKRHIRIMVCTQSIADIDLIYGISERRVIMDNIKFKDVLGCNAPDTQEYFSKLIGEKEDIRLTVSRKSGERTYSESPHNVRICPPAELAQLGEYLYLIYPEGAKKLKKNYFFK